MRPINTVPLNPNIESQLIKFMNQDRMSHFYSIYDFQHQKERTQFWVALSNSKVVGYLMEHDKRILTIRGQKQCTIPLLKNSDLPTPLFNIEPRHLSEVQKLYEPVEPTDKTTIGLKTTFLLMKATPETLTPTIRHEVHELKKENAQAFAELLGADSRRALDLLRGIGYGIFKGDKLISSAVSPEILEDIAIIRGVRTALEERSKGYATSVCSTLVQRLLKQHVKAVILYVSRDNPAAIKVYKRIGFEETAHEFISFTAKIKK